ncbi:uncharacterized protein LOC130367983 [Hyla sarda]|uniref:uncharacterized protein LOC130367983 n=1 Tax=Hyla sarda TaxID=327740 RepID=UPI0024C2497A|nr:uncharacterized protein LOC130367983 [Hyla sarda]XP_056427085.1 uncharacterized protein LOC130367983 [Hyla sarda]XP_056427086.1 uncharacterized protein LOC130367983 [Hyla sarda]XP_056427087.1 uncharacterized protein LOC130367983 [Hyla sarda]
MECMPHSLKNCTIIQRNSSVFSSFLWPVSVSSSSICQDMSLKIFARGAPYSHPTVFGSWRKLRFPTIPVPLGEVHHFVDSAGHLQSFMGLPPGALWDCLPQPSPQDRIHIADSFWEPAQFPNCVGAVDGKHIQKPSNIGSEYYNHEKLFSIILIDSGRQLKVCCSGHWLLWPHKRLQGLQELCNGEIAEARPFLGTDRPVMPFVVGVMRLSRCVATC